MILEAAQTKLDLHSARAFFLKVVLPEYEGLLEILEDGVIGMHRDLRALCRAADACLNMADHVARDPACSGKIPGAPGTGKYHADLASRSQAFAGIRDIANLFKHRTIGRPDRVVSDLDAIDERWALIRAPLAGTEHYLTTKMVLVHLSDGTTVTGDGLIFECLQMWSKELIGLRVIDRPPNITQRLFRDVGPFGRPSITIACEQGEPMSERPLLLVMKPDTATVVGATDEIFDTEVDLHWRIYTSRFADGPRGIVAHPPTTLRIKS